MNIEQLRENIKAGLWILHKPSQRFRRVVDCRVDGFETLLALAQCIKHTDGTTVYIVSAFECQRAYLRSASLTPGASGSTRGGG